MAVCLADGVLLALLEARGRALSGQNLASRLGVTRAAVWKSVRQLRGQGYGVESLPARGYRLRGGLGAVRPGEVSARLDTARFGRELRHLPLADSTNREATRWAERGAPEGALVIADRQSAGRGRLGRSWFALPGESLLMSLVLRPPLSPAIVPQITYVAALSLAQTFSGWVPREDIEIKWPNDVLVGGRKVAGILLEARMEGARAEHVVVGVGVNVGGSVADFPEELRDLAGTLGERAHKEAPTVLDVLCRFLQSFEEGYERFLSGGFEALREDWSGWFRMAGRRVRISGAGEAVEGEVVEMSPDGALVLRLDGGLLHRIHAGDVAWATTKS